MSYSNSVLADDLDRESFAAENEVLSKSGRAFSRYYFESRCFITLFEGHTLDEIHFWQVTLSKK